MTKEERLDRHCEDFSRVQGASFEHFFCPILFTDEKAALCLGHVVNEAFCSSVGCQVIQRTDIDQFYGSRLEADFVTIINADGKRLSEIMDDSALRNGLRPHLTVDGHELPHYRPTGSTPRQHTRLRMIREDEKSIELIVKMNNEEVMTALGGKWAWVIEKDCRTSAVASLIKAAHLTLFHLLGYQYVFTIEGRYVGHDILGEFFLSHVDKPAKEARDAAVDYFKPYANMVRPIVGIEGEQFRGTVEDGVMFCLEGASGRPFALGVHVRTNEQLHSVLLPVFGCPDSVGTYLGFLKNENETVTARFGRYDMAKKEWSMCKDTQRIRWPKSMEVDIEPDLM